MSGRFRGPAAEESVACNLIPMIDIMFLLLLFFMLGADMTKRELEEVKLPTADACKKDVEIGGFGAGRTTVNVFHANAATGIACAVHETGGVCRDPDHWLVAIRGSEFSVGESALRMKDEAESTRDREVMIRADEGAPYSVVQKLIEGCASAGMWKVALSAAQPAKR